MELGLANIREFRSKKLQQNFGFIFEHLDTSSVTGQPYLPVMISETAADYYHSRTPSVAREVIRASQISGIEDNSVLAQFTGHLHADVNLYENFIALFGVVLLAQQSSLAFVRGGYFQTLSPTLLAASFLMLLGFGAKAGLYPLHNWLPSAHPVAPAPAHALLSGIIAKVGAIAAIRVIYFTVGAEALRGTWVQTVCIVLTLVTIFMGSFMGCTENGLKKRLAYSSISQISYVLLGVFLMTPVGLLGGLLQLLFHALAKIGVFQSAGSIIFLTGTETIGGFPGLGRRIPVTMGCFAALALSLVGIPPFGGFFSKWYLALGALDGMSAPLCYIIPAVLLISALLTAAYLFPPLCRAFFPGQDFPAQSRVREPLLLVLSLALFAAASLILGLLSGITVPVMEHITGSIL